MKRNDKPSFWRDMAEIAVFFAVCALVIWLFLAAVRAVVGYFRDGGERVSLESDTVNEEDGVGRVTTAYDVVSPYRGSTVAEEAKTALWVYTEGEGMPPEWYRPDEPMAAEWYAEGANVPVKDIGCPDYNVESTIWGWDGHCMESWEMDLFSKIFYEEFWQPNLTLCEAGCDAMLQLWDLNGGTMFETLSRVNENGSYVFSTYPGIWQENFDPDGLTWCRAYCEERFYEGPSWPAQYFRKGQYHDWDEWSPIPAYEIDGIYFSIGR